jgi:hypothetical protein
MIEYVKNEFDLNSNAIFNVIFNYLFRVINKSIIKKNIIFEWKK